MIGLTCIPVILRLAIPSQKLIREHSLTTTCFIIQTLVPKSHESSCVRFSTEHSKLYIQRKHILNCIWLRYKLLKS